MGYLEEGLMPGEKIIYKTNLHWAIALWSLIGCIFTTVMLALLVVFFIFVVLPQATAPNAWIILLIIVFFVGLVVLVGWAGFIRVVVSFLTTEFGLTNRRVLVKMGLLRRRSLEIVLTQVEGVSVDQSLFGRILGYGTIVIVGSGGTKQAFPSVNAPFELRKRVVEEIGLSEEGGKTKQAGKRR